MSADRSRSPKGKANAVLKVRNPTPTIAQLMHGSAPLGCLYKDCTDEQADQCVAKCLEMGIRYFDTAPFYGAGLSERRVGRALKGRTDVLISTKCGRVIKAKKDIKDYDSGFTGKETDYAGSEGGEYHSDKYHMDRPVWDYTASGIHESVRQSKERLGIEKIHCLRLHDAEDEERWAQATAEGGACDTMIALKKEGKVNEISLGMNQKEYLLRYIRKYPGAFDNIMMAGCFNLVDNDSIELLLECQEQGVKVVNVGVFAAGLLWGGSHYKYDSNIPDSVKDKVSKWTELVAKYDLSLPQVALNFAFLPEIVESCAFGTSRAAAVEQNIALVGKTVPLALWKEAKEMGLIHEAVPLPE